MLSAVKTYIHRHRLLQPGDRVGVAVSGGADSVALLLAMLELQSELGLVLSLVHFNHKIRGVEADADERFVADLARAYNLQLFSGSSDVPAHARETGESLESAAHDLRYEFFRELLAARKIAKIALAHTMDDQAETVLMRFLRGAGTRGLAGIHPQKAEGAGVIVRPLLEIRRPQVEEFLKARGQAWREDSTNRDTHHTRNKIRHELVPVLREYNPAIVETLARTADVARAEEEYWQAEAARLLPLIVLPGKETRGGGRSVGTNDDQSIGIDLQALRKHPLALQRRIIRAAAESLGLSLDVEHVEDVLLVAKAETKADELPDGWRAFRTHRELRIEPAPPSKPAKPAGYDYPAPIPGQVAIPDVNLLVRLHLMPLDEEGTAYNRETSQGPGVFCLEAGGLRPLASASVLRLRNWHEGDRFRQAHSASEKKVKDLLQDLKVPRELRPTWPVMSSEGKVIWVKGARPLQLRFADGQNALQRLVIEVDEGPAKVPPRVEGDASGKRH